MSIIKKKPFIENVLGTLTSTDLNSLQIELNSNGNFIANKHISEIDTGIHTYMVKFNEFLVLPCITIVNTDYSVALAYGDNQSISIYNLNIVKGLYTKIKEYLTISELRRVLYEKLGGGGGGSSAQIIRLYNDTGTAFTSSAEVNAFVIRVAPQYTQEQYGSIIVVDVDDTTWKFDSVSLTWKHGGTDIVTPFTNSNQGTIIGRAEDGYVEHLSGDPTGTGHVRGFESKVDKNNGVLTGTTSAENVTVSGDLVADDLQVDGDATFVNPVTVPNAVADTDAVNKGQVSSLVSVDDTTINRNTDSKLQVKDGGLTVAKFNASAVNKKGSSLSDDDTHLATTGLIKQTIESLEKGFAFKGYVSLTEPTGASSGEYWYNGNSMPTSFPISVKTYDGSAWSSTTTSYTPKSLDLWANLNDNNGYYWFGNAWNLIDADPSPDNVTINKNAAGQLQLKDAGITFSKVNSNFYVTAIDSSATNTEFATAKAVYDYAENKANKVTTIDASSTDTQYPSAKCVYDEFDKVVHIAGDETISGDKTFTSSYGVIVKNSSGVTTNFAANQINKNDGTNSYVYTYPSQSGKLVIDKDLIDKVIVKAGDNIPTASASNVGVTYFCSADSSDGSFSVGGFYKCTENSGVYSYVEIKPLVYVDDVTIDINSSGKLEVKALGVSFSNMRLDSYTTTINSSSSDVQFPTAKAVYTIADTKLTKVTTATGNDQMYVKKADGSNTLVDVPTGTVVDSALSDTSTNPVQNKVINSAINALSGVATIKVVETLPTTTTKNTMYYVGTASPYQIYLYDSDNVQHDLGTTAIDLSEYLKLSGGTMTGTIVCNAYGGILAAKPDDNSELSLWGATSWSNGAMIQLTGGSNTGYNGAFILTARKDETHYAQLRGDYDGSLVWGGNTVCCTSGFTMTGRIYSTNTETIAQATDTSYTWVYGGDGYWGGAGILLYGKDNTTSQGAFEVNAYDGTNRSVLKGTPDGKLTWKDKNVLTSSVDDVEWTELTKTIYCTAGTLKFACKNGICFIVGDALTIASTLGESMIIAEGIPSGYEPKTKVYGTIFADNGKSCKAACWIEADGNTLRMFSNSGNITDGSGRITLSYPIF